MSIPIDEFGLSAPFFVRKLPRRRDWDGQQDDTIDLRATNCYDSAFRDDSGKISVFEIKSSEDMARVAVAVNHSGMPHKSLREPGDYVAMTQDDLRAHNITLEKSPGDTGCIVADDRHHELHDDTEKVTSMIREMMSGDRQRMAVTKGKMRKAIEWLTEENCHCIPTRTDGDCACEA